MLSRKGACRRTPRCVTVQYDSASHVDLYRLSRVSGRQLRLPWSGRGGVESCDCVSASTQPKEVISLTAMQRRSYCGCRLPTLQARRCIRVIKPQVLSRQAKLKRPHGQTHEGRLRPWRQRQAYTQKLSEIASSQKYSHRHVSIRKGSISASMTSDKSLLNVTLRLRS